MITLGRNNGHGPPLRLILTDPPPAVDDRCPRCGAPSAERQLSRTFGPLHDVCGQCGYDFPERTLVEDEP